MSRLSLTAAFDSVHQEAAQLAGGLTDLTQRATVYHHVFQHSGGNHAFPLIAAHGALWARGYFPRCLQLGQILSYQFAFSPSLRSAHLESLDRFADAIRDINRRVCVDTYTNYHFTARFGHHPEASALVSPQLLPALNQIHAAREAGRQLRPDEMRSVFEAHFLYEQQHVVGPTIEAAMADFDWPLVKFFALRPIVRFAYFPARHHLFFRDFSQREERVRHGLEAFEMAQEAGWSTVAETLRNYQALPEPFFANPVQHFAQLRQTVLA